MIESGQPDRLRLIVNSTHYPFPLFPSSRPGGRRFFWVDVYDDSEWRRWWRRIPPGPLSRLLCVGAVRSYGRGRVVGPGGIPARRRFRGPRPPGLSAVPAERRRRGPRPRRLFYHAVQLLRLQVRPSFLAAPPSPAFVRDGVYASHTLHVSFRVPADFSKRVCRRGGLFKTSM